MLTIAGWVIGGFVVGWIASDVYRHYSRKGRWG